MFKSLVAFFCRNKKKVTYYIIIFFSLVLWFLVAVAIKKLLGFNHFVNWGEVLHMLEVKAGSGLTEANISIDRPVQGDLNFMTQLWVQKGEGESSIKIPTAFSIDRLPNFSGKSKEYVFPLVTTGRSADRISLFLQLSTKDS